MVETVVERWSKDIDEMENKATQRWKNDLDAFKDVFSKDVEAMNKEAQKLFSHIWGTQADRKAWQEKYGR